MQSVMLELLDHLGPFHFEDFISLPCLLNKFCCLRGTQKLKIQILSPRFLDHAHPTSAVSKITHLYAHGLYFFVLPASF